MLKKNKSAELPLRQSRSVARPTFVSPALLARTPAFVATYLTILTYTTSLLLLLLTTYVEGKNENKQIISNLYISVI